MLLDISCDSKRETQAAVKEASDQKTVRLSLSINHSNAPVLILLKNAPFILEGSDDSIPTVSRLHAFFTSVTVHGAIVRNTD